MASPNAPRDGDRNPALLGTSSTDGVTPVTVYVNPTTHRLLVDNASSGGSITSINADTTAAQVIAAGTGISVSTTAGTTTITNTGSGGTPGGLNTQIQYNNSGAFGGITGAVTDGTSVSLNAPHLLNPTINGAGTGLATLTYPNTSTSVSIALPATAGTVALTSQLTSGTVTSVSVVSANGFAGTVATSTTTPAITISTSISGILVGNGTSISAATTTGIGTVVLNSSPTLSTPVLGVATATTINKVTFTAPATGSTLTIADGKTLTVNNTLTFSGTDGTTMTMPGASATLAGLATTQTFTNKRITSRIGTTTSSATPTPDGDNNDQYNVTALATGATFGAPTGTPTDGQKLIIRIKDNATPQTLAFNAIYRFSSSLTAPTTTIASKTLYLGFIFNSADSKWDNIAQLNNF